MTLQAVHAGSQALYVGNEGRLAFTIRDRSTGSTADLTESGLNLSRAVFHMAGRTVDSEVYPAAFDWTNEGTRGRIEIDLTGFAFPSGSFGARLVLFCLDHPNGLVAADSYPVNVGQALVGTIPAQADVNTLFAVLANDTPGQGSDRVAWVGQTPAKTLSEGLEGLAEAHATHLSDADAHGAVGEVVGTLNAQTLGNKALTSPTLNYPIIDLAGWTNANHDHSSVAKGGTLPKTALQDGCFATQAEQEAASATDVAVSPGRQHFHPSAAKAWVRFNGCGTLTILERYNVSSITDNGVGDYTVNFTTAFSNTTYIAIGLADPTIGTNQTPRQININSQTTSALRITHITTSVSFEDADYISVVVFGDQ